MSSLITIGILGCIILLMLLIASVPVGFALALVGAFGFALAAGNPEAAYHLVVSVTYDNFSKYDLSVIPLFIFMGQIAFHAGISSRLFHAAYCWLGRFPGGLGLAAMGACAGFCSICGSGPASAATMTAVALPEMRKYKYSLDVGCGIVAAGSSLGIMIPPSVVFIVYAIMTENSPARLFAAGVIPCLIIIAMFFAYISYLCIAHPELGPANKEITWHQRFMSILNVLDVVALFILVMGGMLFWGWFTPTEAAAVGAFGSLLIALCRRSMTWRKLWKALEETIRTSCMVLVIVTGALIFGRFLALTGITSDLAGNLSIMPVPAWVKMSVILVFFMIAGCFVDALALVMLTMPIFLPVIRALGYDPVWFGTMVVVIVQLGVITPPVGVNVYVVSGIEREVPMQTIFRRALPFAGIIIIGAILLMLFPKLALALPHWLYD